MIPRLWLPTTSIITQGYSFAITSDTRHLAHELPFDLHETLKPRTVLLDTDAIGVRNLLDPPRGLVHAPALVTILLSTVSDEDFGIAVDPLPRGQDLDQLPRPLSVKIPDTHRHGLLRNCLIAVEDVDVLAVSVFLRRHDGGRKGVIVADIKLLHSLLLLLSRKSLADERLQWGDAEDHPSPCAVVRHLRDAAHVKQVVALITVLLLRLLHLLIDEGDRLLTYPGAGASELFRCLCVKGRQPVAGVFLMQLIRTRSCWCWRVRWCCRHSVVWKGAVPLEIAGVRCLDVIGV